MPKIKDPNYETREMLLERCARQKRTIRIMQTQLELATRTLARIGEMAVASNRQISSLMEGDVKRKGTT